MATCLEVPLSLVIHPRVRKAAARIVVATGLAVFAGTGAALASCTTPPVSTPFSQWGDTSSYFAAPGGSFEGTADEVGWTLSGASLSAGNEPFDAGDPAGTQSLTIGAGGSATSPYFCVDNTMPDLRFFAQQLAPGGDLNVEALVQGSDGVTPVAVGDLADGTMSSWAPTPPLAGNSGSLPDGRTVQVALRFSVPAGSASWQMDDVYIDPYRAG